VENLDELKSFISFARPFMCPVSEAILDWVIKDVRKVGLRPGFRRNVRVAWNLWMGGNAVPICTITPVNTATGALKYFYLPNAMHHLACYLVGTHKWVGQERKKRTVIKHWRRLSAKQEELRRAYGRHLRVRQ
jgi:hypothetical protein